MIMRWILLMLVALVGAMAANAAEYITEIELLKGEKWWGLDFNGRLEQPLSGSVGEPEKMEGQARVEPYRSIMVSNAGRYIYSEKPLKKVEFGDETITITSEYEKIEVEKGGKTLREAYVVCALKNLAPGHSPALEMFAMPQYLMDGDFAYMSEDVVLGYAEKLLAEGFPPGIIVVDDGWQKVSGPYGFDPELFPDPKGMVDKLHELGFKIMLTITPNVPNWGSVYGMARDNNQIINWALEKSPVTLDIGNDEQFSRLRSGLEKIKDVYGFDGFCFDWQEDVPPDSVKFITNMMSLGEGVDMACYRKVIDRPYASYLGCIWHMQDNEDFSPLITKAITAGLMGYPYATARLDPSGERQMADYLLLQCGMPVLSVDFAPWRITDHDLYEKVKEAVNFRASIGDYVSKLAADSRRTGEPIVRHMEYQFPKSGFFDCDDQFMLGSQYLFAPCVDGADQRLVRFPKGTWLGRNGEKIKGPVVKQVDCSAGELIVFEAAR